MKQSRLIQILLIVLTLSSVWQAGPIQRASAQSPDPNTTIYLPFAVAASAPQLDPDTWPMAAGNLERTSWSAEEVTGNLHVEWYRPVEAYISQNVQLIASDGLIFVSTARGLYALNAVNGDVAWRYDTEMPLGNSPTVVSGIVYVGGYDRKLHALRASDGQHLWSFDGAGAGFSTNPLVVDGKVIAGNRDGWMYAIGAHGTSQQGQLIWKFKTDGLIDLSAAYKNGVVYFASNDNYAYALRVSDGSLIWKSDRLPGDGYQSYWPVIYQDKVIFSAASSYRNGITPGTTSVKDGSGEGYGRLTDIERDDIFAGASIGAFIGDQVSGQAWANGKTVLNGSRITNYLESKPWRRVMIVLNQSDGSEYTFDSDGDGIREYMPVTLWGTHSGNRFPPIVGADGLIYVSNFMQYYSIPQGKVMGWKIGTSLLSLVGGQGAVDEPQAISGGGSVIYTSICCDRAGTYASINSNQTGQFWSYSNTLSQQIPGYDAMWYGVSPQDNARLHGNFGTQNGIYNNHGDQNPIIPYNGRIYIHRSNTIIAYGPGSGTRALPLLETADAPSQSTPISVDDLKARLEAEIQEMVAAGHLRPGYYNNGQFNYAEYASYFENPGDTLYTLAIAIPYLSPQLQDQARDYLRSEFQTYFDPIMYARIGWEDGAPRESMPIPPEAQQDMISMEKMQNDGNRTTWAYPPFNFYAMWKYALVFPQDAGRAYNLAKTKLQVPSPAPDATLQSEAYELNAYIAGYIGFLNLQEQAGYSAADSQLRAQVTSELNRLTQMRANTFTKDAPWLTGNFSYHLRTFNVSHNFIDLVPELGDYLNQHAQDRVAQALNEYSWVAPYWFVTRYNGAINEGGRQNLYDSPSLFRAKAYILKQDRSELVKYLDTPAFERGDLFYIQNLVIAIEAP